MPNNMSLEISGRISKCLVNGVLIFTEFRIFENLCQVFLKVNLVDVPEGWLCPRIIDAMLRRVPCCPADKKAAFLSSVYENTLPQQK